MHRRVIVVAAALASLLLAGVLLLGFRGRDEPSAEDVALSFVEAYGALDAEEAISHLAEDADISAMVASIGASDVEGTLDEFRLLIASHRAKGYKHMHTACEELGASDAGALVQCTFDFHSLRSDEIGRGPFRGSSIDVTVRDGEIVRGATHWAIAEFSQQMWEPFASWVSKSYPKDAALMYEDETYSGSTLSEKSNQLWERHTREYVDVVRQLRSEDEGAR
jgi:hypothetical protein